ncbi:MAG: protease modulator HflC [Candidatus Eisenbacteria bacterium]
MIRRILIAIAIVLGVAWATSALFTVDAAETALVTRFGRPLDGTKGPGIHLKAPWPIDQVVRLDGRLLVFDNEPTEMLTQDKKNVLVDSFVCWRIIDPLRFAQTVQNRAEAEARLLDLSSSELGATIGAEPMESFLDPNGGEVRYSAVSAKVAEEMNRITQGSFGIEVVDFRINGFNLPAQNRGSVIDRMRAERSRQATRYRSEGEEAALKIEAETAAERERILAFARAQAESLKGVGEAEALRILGQAYSQDPEFYRFVRSLESYEKILGEETTVFLESDSKLLRHLEGK